MKRTAAMMIALMMMGFVGVRGDSEAGWVDLGSLYPGQAPDVHVVETPTGLEVTMTIYGFYAHPIPREGEIFHQLTIPRCGSRGDVGEPELPFRHIMLHLPHGMKFNYQLIELETVVAMEAVQVFPHQPPEPDCGPHEPKFVWNRETYAKNRTFPVTPARLTLDGVIRGTRVIGFQVQPLQVNPGQQEITALKRLRLAITFEGKADPIKSARGSDRAHPFFDSCLDTFLLNGIPERSMKNLHQKSGTVEYLVIVADDFLEEIEPLADWKRRKGYEVDVVPTSVTGTAAADVLSYLQGVYDTTPSLTYVLLVGDQPQIPGYPVSPDAYGGAFVSDLPYTLLDGTDYFPDVVLGRISVETEAQCTTVVDKILAYDRTPVAADWYNDFLLAAYLQDYNDYNCYADRWFFETGTHVMHFMRDTVGAGIYTAATTDSLSCDPYHYRSDSYPHRPEFPDPSDFTVPAADAALFTDKPTSTQDVIDAINAGVALVQHRDHGGEDGWGEPPFTTANIYADLSNGSRTPVVFSINCLTGKFDHGSPCFAEAFQRLAGAGAVGLVAATEVSYSGYNDLLTHGLYDSFWNDYDTDDGGNSYAHSWRPAEALMYAKHYMYTFEGDSEDTLYEFRLFQWFGDPEMMLRLGPQTALVVSHTATLPVGVDQVIVTCSADGAQVAVSDNGVLLGRGTITGGTVDMTLNPAPAAATTLDVVVTGRNLVPYEGTITVEWDPCDDMPVAQTDPATEVGGTVARLHGRGNPQGCNAIGYFEYGTATGVYSQQTAAVSLGADIADVPYQVDISGLQPSTPYVYRAVVESGWGVVYGEEATFTTLTPLVLLPPALQTPTPGQTGLDPLSVTLTWLDTNTSPEEAGMEIRYRRRNDAQYQYLALPAGTLTADLPALLGLTQYCWNVRATGDQNFTVDSPWGAVVDWEFATDGDEVLVVNGDSGSDFSGYITPSVTAAGYTHDVFLRTSSNPVTLDLLTQYRAIVWTTGDDFNSGSTMTGVEETALRDYLDSGGTLYFSSQDYIYSLVGGSAGNSAPGSFLRDYLGVDWYDSDVSDYSAVEGLGEWSGLSADLNQITPMSSYFDLVIPTDAAAPLFGVTGTADIGGVYSTDSAVRSAFTAFPFENIVAEADRHALMQAILDHLLAEITALLPPTLTTPVNGATDQSTSLLLEWVDANSSPNETGFEIRYKRATDPDYSTMLAGADAVSALLDGLENGTEYVWNVRATGDGATAADSPWANAETDWSFMTYALPTLLPPLLSSPSAGAGNLPPDIQIDWTDTNTSPNELGYEVRYRLTGAPDYSYETIAADGTTWTLSGCLFGAQYEWNVRAVGDGSALLNSDWANAGVDWTFSRGRAGDVNKDAVVDAQDLILLAGYLAGNVAAGDICTWNGDCNGNGQADSVDLAELIAMLNQP
ncbi:MAG: hypothetical protein JXQ27_12945 [Acidobacteria bacterium]|nr:hypothetical protein [Acidobacteriota bacterium]